MPAGGFDFVLISKKVMELVLEDTDSNPFWQGQILWTGYEPKLVFYERKKRKSGTSRWTFSKKIKYLLDGVLGYSYAPIRAISIFVL